MAQDSRLILAHTAEGDLEFRGRVHFSDVVRMGCLTRADEMLLEWANSPHAPVSIQLEALAMLFHKLERNAGKHV